jgi:hypothetical protein
VTAVDVPTWRSALVVSFVDLYTAQPPVVVPSVNLAVRVPVLDRNGHAVADGNGVTVTQFVDTDYRPSWTASRRLVFAALDFRSPATGSPVPVVPPPHYRLSVATGGLIAHPRDVEFDAPVPGGLTTTQTIRLVPGPNYAFPPRVVVARGSVVSQPGAPARVFAITVTTPPPQPSNFTGSQVGLTDEAGRFSVGLRAIGSLTPFTLAVADASTGAALTTVSVPDPHQPIVINV